MATWKASNERVVIQLAEQQKTTASGLILPDKMKAVVQQGRVLAVGGEVKGLLPGDQAFFEAKYATPIAENVVSIEAISVLAGVRED